MPSDPHPARYHVSHNPTHGWRWWSPDGPYSITGPYFHAGAEQNVHEATGELAVVIKRLATLSQRGASVPASLCAEFLELAAQGILANAK